MLVIVISQALTFITARYERLSQMYRLAQFLQVTALLLRIYMMFCVGELRIYPIGIDIAYRMEAFHYC